QSQQSQQSQHQLVYPRHSRYAGSREVLEFLECSLHQYAPTSSSSCQNNNNNSSSKEDDEASSQVSSNVNPRQSSSSTINQTSAPPPTSSSSTLALSCPNCFAPLLV